MSAGRTLMYCRFSFLFERVRCNCLAPRKARSGCRSSDKRNIEPKRTPRVVFPPRYSRTSLRTIISRQTSSYGNLLPWGALRAQSDRLYRSEEQELRSLN